MALRRVFAFLAIAACALVACSSGFAVRPRKVDATSTKLIYVWFIAQAPAGAPAGFHGCEVEVTVEPHSQQVLGYSLSNIGWAKCGEIARKVRVVAS
jgi:hypothetical protein